MIVNSFNVYNNSETKSIDKQKAQELWLEFAKVFILSPTGKFNAKSPSGFADAMIDDYIDRFGIEEEFE